MSTVSTAAHADAGSTEKQKSKKPLMIGLLVLLLGGGAAWWFLLRPDDGTKAEEDTSHHKVVTLEPIQVNLADGKYLRVGIALDLAEGVEEEVDGSKALDAALTLLSGEDAEELGQSKERARLKAELTEELTELYEGEVHEVLFTDFVTQ